MRFGEWSFCNVWRRSQVRRTMFGAIASAAVCLAAVLGVSLAAAAQAHTTKAASGAAIRIGAVCTCSGPQGGGQAGVQSTDDAWVKWTNAHGGINGYPVKLYFLDDTGDATTSTTDALTLINRDHVQAIAGWWSGQADSWAKDVQKARIPVIGSTTANTVEYTNPDFFPNGVNSISFIYSVAEAAKQYHRTKVAVFYCAESPICATIPGAFSGIAKLVGGGVQVVNSEEIAAADPSYAAQCLAGKASGATDLVFAGDSATAKRLFTQCAQQGWHPADGNGALAYDAVKDIPGGVDIQPGPTLGIGNTTAPAGKLFHEIIAKYDRGLPASAGYDQEDGWAYASLQEFAKAAMNAKLTPTSSPAAVIRGLDRFKHQTLGGEVGPLTYTPGKPTFGNCWFYSYLQRSHME